MIYLRWYMNYLKKGTISIGLLFCMAACAEDEIPSTDVIAFTRDGKIHLMGADGANIKPLSGARVSDAHYLAWSPDARMLAYDCGKWDGLYKIDLSSSEVTKVVDMYSASHPGWSPDGNQLAFTVYNFPVSLQPAIGSNITRVFVADLRSSEVLPTNLALDSLQLFQSADAFSSWSPDGKRILFSSNRPLTWEDAEANSDIYMMDPDGTNVDRLTNTRAHEWWPTWSPDGEKIAFVGAGADNISSSIYLMNADGTGLFQVTHNLSSGHYLTWSPDGTRLAFDSDHEGNHEIYVINVDGTGLKRLTNHPGEDRFPAWAPLPARTPD